MRQVISGVLVILCAGTAYATGARSAPAAADDLWDIRTTHRSEGMDMMGRMEVPTGTRACFVWRLGPGRGSVQTLADERKVGLDDVLPPLETEVAESRHDFLLLLSVEVELTARDRVHVTGRAGRWEPETHFGSGRYVWSVEAIDTELEYDEPLRFAAGATPQGMPRTIDLYVVPGAAGTADPVQVSGLRIPVEVSYELWDARREGEPVHRAVQVADYSAGRDGESLARFAVPVHVAGRDSCEIHVTVSLKDVMAEERAGRSGLRAQGTLAVERTLVLDIIPAPTAGTIQASTMIESGFEHRLNLRPHKTIRVELPLQEYAGFPGSLSEVVVIRPLVPGSSSR